MAKNDLTTGANIEANKHDASAGYPTREAFTASMKAMVEAGTENRKLRRGLKALDKKRKKKARQ